MTDLEREAREAAKKRFPDCLDIDLVPVHDRWGRKAFIDGYLAAAALRDQEIERMRAREKLWSEYVALMVESEKLTITMFHVHGGRFPVEMIERGKRLRYALGLE